MATITQTLDANGNQIFDVAMNGDQNLITLATADTYVDKNIQINMREYYDAGKQLLTEVTNPSTGVVSTVKGEIFNTYTGSNKNQATGNYSHAEGGKTVASELYAHAQGYNTTAGGRYSHSEGSGTTASGNYSHTQGYNTTASNAGAHAEGYNNTASGQYSHAQGSDGIASHNMSHTEGRGSLSGNNYQHVQGQYNVQSTGYAHIIGWGSSDANRKNIHTVTTGGDAWFAKDVYVGSTSGLNKDSGSKRLATEEYVNNHNSIQGLSVTYESRTKTLVISQ